MDVLVDGLDEEIDSVQCLRDAGLLENTDDAYEFWAGLQRRARLRLQDHLSEMGTRGELLSYEREKRRIAAERIDVEPIWISRRDDTRGYDIESYLREAGTIQAYFIEVKAHRGSFAFHLSRNQWTIALSSPDHYIIHLWDLRTEQVIEIRPRELIPIMPREPDARIISWESVEIHWLAGPRLIR